jgi:hypothetical protein
MNRYQAEIDLLKIELKDETREAVIVEIRKQITELYKLLPRPEVPAGKSHHLFS